MRGSRDPQATMLTFVDLEERVPQDHPIRTIKIIADEALDEDGHDTINFVSPRPFRWYQI